jgi:signal transduction histidine kinase
LHLILAIDKLLSDFSNASGHWELPFTVLVAVLLSLLVHVFWRQRLRRLTRQKNELSLAVMLRTREIRKEKATVERHQKQIEKLLEESQRSNRLKDEFLANISHEIRTPLHGVLGMTELTLGTGLTEEQREYLQVAESSARSLLALLNDVLDFSKIEARQLELDCIPFSLRDCVHQTVGAFPASARQKGLAFELHIAENTPEWVEGDPMRLGQILTNLLGNAIKFTAKGKVRVDVSSEVESDGRCLTCFSVEDTGIGIPRANWETIFEPFRQADGSMTRKYGGTGLGLSICQRLVNQMGGSLALDSEVGVGTTFTFTIPMNVLQQSPAIARQRETVDDQLPSG